MASQADFDAAFAFTVGVEGRFSNDPQDSGNWTSGEIGIGQLKGTKFGISAASFPTLDIENLTLVQAQSIYFSNYWEKLSCQSFPSSFAKLLFDCGVSQGINFASLALQKLVLVKQDGVIGPVTVQATLNKISILTLGEGGLCVLFFGARLSGYTADSTFSIYGQGWMNRIASLCNMIIG